MTPFYLATATINRPTQSTTPPPERNSSNIDQRFPNGGGATGVEQSPVLAQLMAATGLVALLLMALHLGWAVVTMIRDRFDEKRVFHRFSIVVWVIWLIPYFTGMAAARA